MAPKERSPALVLAFLLAGVALAGCLGNDEEERGDGPVAPGEEDVAHPFALFLCTDGYWAGDAALAVLDRCNHRITKPLVDPNLFDVVNQHGPGNEVSIAVNPLDPLNAAGGAKDYTVSYVSDFAGCGEFNVWMGTYWTYDGGLTWGNDLMPGFPGDTRASPLAGQHCNTDPVLVFDDDGTLWYSGLNYNGGREDSPTAPLPNLGGDWLTGTQLYFARSDDGGATYPFIGFAAHGEGDAIFHDKQWYAVQPGGDHMIATWSMFYGTGPVPVPAGNVQIVYSESLDAGETWSEPRAMPAGTASPTLSVQFSMPQYLPSGDLAIIWADFSQSGVRGGLGGGTTQLAYAEGTLTPGGVVWGAPMAAFPMNALKSEPGRDGTGPSEFRLSTYPVLAIDTSGGSCDGRRYVVWSDQPGEVNTDVETLLRYSDDGQTWSEPVTVNDIEAGDQLMPWIDVDPDGGVHVAFYDRRNDPENRLLDVYYAYSDTCGEAFHPNVRVTETNFDGDLGHHQSGSTFIGDYIGLDTTAVSAHIIWADTRHSCELDDTSCTAPMRVGSDVYAATLLKDLSARAAFDAAYG